MKNTSDHHLTGHVILSRTQYITKPSDFILSCVMRGKNEWIWDARDEEAGVGLVTIPPTDAMGIYAPYP